MTAEKKLRPTFWWWNCSDLQEEGLFAMLVKEGADHLRLEFHPDRKLLILVDQKTGEPCGEYNITQTCPPVCP